MVQGLYGVKQESKTKHKAIPSSTAQAFSSNLASLISSSSTSTKPEGRSKLSKGKADLFTAHRTSKKRSAKELEDGEQKHQTKDDIGSVSAAELQRAKKRMEDKVRLYNAMKRGEYVKRGDGFDDRGLVDFDRKWAERNQQGKGGESDELDSSDEDAEPDDNEPAEYMDEFGRLRKGTKKDVRREERRLRIQEAMEADQKEFAVRPEMPTNIIYGDAVQHQAFNPERDHAEKMAKLARKRDKSATPPPDTHFDASAEVRTRGTGFYGFSQDAEARKKQMEELEKTRLETERIRQEKKDEREREDKMKQETARAEADKFLAEFQLPSD